MDASWAVGVAGNTTGPGRLFFQLCRRGGKEKKWQTCEWGKVRMRESVEERLGSPQREGKGIRWDSAKPPLRPWQPVIQTIRELTVLPTTVLHTAKKMTKINTGCVFVGGISVEPHSLSWSITLCVVRVFATEKMTSSVSGRPPFLFRFPSPVKHQWNNTRKDPQIREGTQKITQLPKPIWCC